MFGTHQFQGNNYDNKLNTKQKNESSVLQKREIATSLKCIFYVLCCMIIIIAFVSTDNVIKIMADVKQISNTFLLT